MRSPGRAGPVRITIRSARLRCAHRRSSATLEAAKPSFMVEMGRSAIRTRLLPLTIRTHRRTRSTRRSERSGCGAALRLAGKQREESTRWEGFEIESRVGGQGHLATAHPDGDGYTVVLGGAHKHARSSTDALRIVREFHFQYLARADRSATRWGLRVAVAEVQAVYGDWPRFPAREPSPMRREESLVARIHAQWINGSAVSALENATEAERRGYEVATTHAI